MRERGPARCGPHTLRFTPTWLEVLAMPPEHLVHNEDETAQNDGANRRYTSMLYIYRSIHGVGYNPVNNGRRYTIGRRYSAIPRAGGPLYLRRL